MIRYYSDKPYSRPGSPTSERRHSSQPVYLFAPCRASFTPEILRSFDLLPSARVAYRIRVATSSAYTRIAKYGAVFGQLEASPRSPASSSTYQKPPHPAYRPQSIMQAVPESRQQTFEELYGPPENFLEIEVRIASTFSWSYRRLPQKL